MGLGLELALGEVPALGHRLVLALTLSSLKLRVDLERVPVPATSPMALSRIWRATAKRALAPAPVAELAPTLSTLTLRMGLEFDLDPS